MHALLLTAVLLTASPSSEVVLDGSSNVADWRCRGTAIDAEMTVAAADLNEVIDFDLNIPVNTFRCGNRVMESDMREALKADRHPNVTFSFREVLESDVVGNHVTIVGDLTLAGVTRKIDLNVSAQRLSRTSFRVRATLPLRMTDFGITPPSALFGAIRARNSLTVRFDLILNVRPL